MVELRGSTHDRSIHEYTINGSGMQLGAPFRNVTGILGGHPTLDPEPVSSLDEVADLFAPRDGETSP